MYQLIDGKALAKKIRTQIKKEVARKKIKPGLTVIMVGKNPASEVYVNSKEKMSLEVGFNFERYRLPEKTTEKTLLRLIQKLNKKSSIHGFIVQLPLPRHLDEDKIIRTIDPTKDVDGLHPMNLGKLLLGQPTFRPATAQGIIELLDYAKINLAGKRAVVIGRSNIVGKPVALLLTQKNATVTLCHSKTKNLKSHTLLADVIVVAAGVPNLLKGSMVKKGATVIDVGINRVDKKLVGDVDFKNVCTKASCITPVPGGVGPMTVAILLKNTLLAHNNNSI